MASGHVGLASEGGVGSIEPPKSWGGGGGGGGWEKGSIDWHHESDITGAEGADNFFEHHKWSKNFFSPNTWQMMTFLNLLDTLIPKIPFSFCADFWVWVTSEARGSVSLGFWVSCQFSPFLGGMWV